MRCEAVVFPRTFDVLKNGQTAIVELGVKMRIHQRQNIHDLGWCWNGGRTRIESVSIHIFKRESVPLDFRTNNCKKLWLAYLFLITGPLYLSHVVADPQQESFETPTERKNAEQT